MQEYLDYMKLFIEDKIEYEEVFDRYKKDKHFADIVNDGLVKFNIGLGQSDEEGYNIDEDGERTEPESKVYDDLLAPYPYYFGKSFFYNSICWSYKSLTGEEPKRTDRHYKEHSMLLDILPEYIDGTEAINYVKENVFNKLDEWPTKVKDKKALKDKIKEMFHIEGNKYPCWVQGGEWPILNGKPMKYVKRTSKYKGEVVCFHFVDVDTGEVKVIEQFY